MGVSLREVADAMDTICEESAAYLNRKSGDVVILLADDIEAVEDGADIQAAELPEWQREVYQDVVRVTTSPDFLLLPSQFDFHEWEIMASYSESVASPQLRAQLLSDIKGKGAFRRFRARVAEHGLLEDWYRYKQETLDDIAARFLDDKGISYERPDATSDRRAATTETPQTDDEIERDLIALALLASTENNGKVPVSTEIRSSLASRHWIVDGDGSMPRLTAEGVALAEELRLQASKLARSLP